MSAVRRAAPRTAQSALRAAPRRTVIARFLGKGDGGKVIQSPFRRIAAAAMALLGAGIAWADDPDASALLLADQTPSVVEKAGDWRTFVEGAVGGTVERSDGSSRDNRRLSVDIQYDHSFSAEWRAFFSDRLDLNRPVQRDDESAINTLKEAYLTWRTQAETMLDLGRINVRNGVATGYNPTDYFRGGALRSVVSISPASLKENRQGSILLRGQRLWDAGSLTALYSPKLDDRASPDGLSLDVGATNQRNRGLIAVSQKVGETLTPQFLVYREDAGSTQFGLNLTSLVDAATVAHFEWSGGRSSSLLNQAQNQALPACSCSAWRNHLATGLTYTTPGKISLTVEYQHSGSGLDKEGWDALRQGPLPVYGEYRSLAQAAQELPTRRAVFFYGTWQDALIDRLDLGVMHNYDLIDSSRRLWLEARYRLERFEYAVQWQRYGGQRLSNFGAQAETRSWQAVMRYYL